MVNRRLRSSKRSKGGTASITRAIGKLERGVALRPSVDPPSYNPAPWWPMTVVTTIKADTTVNGTQLHTSILASLGQSNVNYAFKLVSIRVWGLNRQPLKLTPYEHFGGSTPLRAITDYGDPVHYSRLGYRWGVSSKIDVHTASDTNILYAVHGKLDATNMALCYASLLIRIKDPVAPTALEAIVDSMSSMPHDMVIV